MVSAYFDLVEKSNSIQPKQDASVFEKFLANLLDKLADSKASTKAVAAYKRMFKVKQLDCAFLLAFLFKPSSFVNKNGQASHKHLVPRLGIV